MTIRLVTPKNQVVSRVLPAKTSVAVSSGFTVGTLVRESIVDGAVQKAIDATNANLYIAQQTVLDTDNTTPVLSTIVYSGDEFTADTTANSNTAENGRRFNADATGLLITNGADVPAGLFMQVSTQGVAADKKIIVRRV